MSKEVEHAVEVIEALCCELRVRGGFLTDAYLDGENFMNQHTPAKKELLDIVEASIPEVAASRMADEDDEEDDFLRFRARSGSNCCWTEDELFQHISATEQFKKMLRKLYDKKILDVHEIINITGLVPEYYYLKGEYFHVE